MEFICLVYHDEKKLDVLSEGELDALVGECGAWVEVLAKGGYHVASTGLQPVRTATTLRERNGRLSMTDGPFAETREQLAGFTIIDARNLDEALLLAARFPAARLGSIEVRPINPTFFTEET